MALEKTSFVDSIEVAYNGIVQVRTRTEVKDGEAVVSSSFHRYSIIPGQDYSAEDEQVQSVCAKAHTAEVIESFKASIPQ